MSAWTDIAPAFVLAHDDGRLPYPERSAAILNPVRAPDYDGSDPLGLLIWGPPGAGKTRTVWQDLRGQVLDGITLRALDLPAITLASEMNAEAQAVWLAELLRFDALLVDDIGSDPLTWESASLLRRVLDGALANLSPSIHATAQVAGNDLLRIWCARERRLEPIALACLRRLRDLCRVEYLGP